MNLLDVDQLAGEVVSRDDFSIQMRDCEYRQEESVQSNDNAAVALEMVSKAAAAIRELEEQSAQAVARAQDLVSSIAKQLESEEARAERAETAQKLSEAEVKELAAALARIAPISRSLDDSWPRSPKNSSRRKTDSASPAQRLKPPSSGRSKRMPRSSTSSRRSELSSRAARSAPVLNAPPRRGRSPRRFS